MSDTTYSIIREIYRALETLGADLTLLGAIGSWGDTLEDEDVLAILEEWNRNREGKKS